MKITQLSTEINRGKIMKKGITIVAVAAAVGVMLLLVSAMMPAKANKVEKALKTKLETTDQTTTKTKTDTAATEDSKDKASTPAQKAKKGKKVFLTFDDGPGTNVTPKVLSLLKKYDMHATFFIVGHYAKQHPELVKRAYEQGNQIGIHTWSHNYRKIYSSKKAFFEDFDKTERLIIKITGEKPTVCRLPGGSNNSYLKRSMAVSIVKELRSRGYTVVDWNASSEDATGINYSSKKMAHFAIRDIRADKKPVVLSHDASFKHKTPATAALIIKYCEKHGYNCVTMKEYTGKAPLFIKVK